MKERKVMLGPLGMQFFPWTQLENKEQVKTGDNDDIQRYCI